MAGLHGVADVDDRLDGAAPRRNPHPTAGVDAEPGRVGRAHPQRALRISLAPAGVTEDRVRGERAPLAGGEHERILVRGMRVGCVAKHSKAVEHLRDVDVELAVGRRHLSPGVFVVLDGEDGAVAVTEERIEERLAEFEAFTLVPRPSHRIGIRHGGAVCRRPQHGRRGSAVGEGLAQRRIQQHRRHPAQQGIRRRRREEGSGELGPVAFRGRPQRGDQLVVDRPEGATQPVVDLGLGERPRQRVEDRRPQAEHVGGELEGEEGRFPLLVLRRRREDVAGFPCRLGHGDIDDDAELQRPHRLAEASRIGERVRRVGGLDDHRPVAVGMVGEDLVGDDVARHHASDDPLPGDG